MTQPEREILERAVGSISEQAVAAQAVVVEAHVAGLDDSHTVAIRAKMLRLELLQMKGYLERELGLLVLDCSECGQTAHYVAGLRVTPGHWAHAMPAPHGEPTI